MKLILVFALMLASLQGFAQLETRALSLRGTEHVPLYDCSIFDNHYDSQRLPRLESSCAQQFLGKTWLCRELLRRQPS